MLFSAGLGGLIGTIFLSFYSKIKRFGVIHTNSAILIGLGVLVLSFAPDINIALVVIGFLGIVGMSFGVVNNTLTQGLVDDKYRGRVMSLYQLTWAGTSFGGLIIGIIAENTTVRDAFAFNGIITIISEIIDVAMEDLGLFTPGEASRAVDDGRTSLNGELPINTSGGLKAKGHPVGASGVAQAAEVFLQLSGKAESRQVQKRDLEFALSQSVGGAGGTSVVTIYERG